MLTDKVYNAIIAEIVERKLPPGSALSEVALAKRLGASRAPIRDSIRRLELEGLAHRNERGTAIVTERTAEGIFHLYEARIALEGEVATRAASRATDFDIVRIRASLSAYDGGHDYLSIRQNHHSWHRSVAIACRNDVMLELLDRLLLQLSPYDSEPLASPPNNDKTFSEHEAITEAIAARDAALARTLIVAHLQRTSELRVAGLLNSNYTPRAASQPRNLATHSADSS